MTKEIRDAGRIEVAHHWTLKWEDYHGLVDYLYRSSVILNVLVKDRTRDEDLKMLLVLKMEEGTRSWKGQENAFPLESPDGNTALPTP